MPAPVEQGVFNVTDAMGAIPGLYSDGTHAADNSTNLNAMIVELLTPGGITNGQGGTLEFPSASPNTGDQASYVFDSTIVVGPVSDTNYPFNIIFRGTGAQSRAFPLLQMIDSTQDFFQINNSESGDTTKDDNLAGIVFEDLILSFSFTEGQMGGGNGIVVQHGGVKIQGTSGFEVGRPGATVRAGRS